MIKANAKATKAQIVRAIQQKKESDLEVIEPVTHAEIRKVLSAIEKRLKSSGCLTVLLIDP